MKFVILKIFLLFLFWNANYNFATELTSSGQVTDVLIIKNDNGTSADQIKIDLEQAKYNVNMIAPELVTPEMFNEHRLVILSTGSNLFPCTDNNMRFLLQSFIDDGGKVIVEGGQTGYVSDVIPEYPAFKSKVMKIDSWQNDNGGSIIISNEYRNSMLATFPNILKDSINIKYSGQADMDVCAKNEFSKLFYKTEMYPDKLGILVFPNVLTPQIINLFFCYSRIDDISSAKHLIINCAYNLIGKPIGIEVVSTEIPEKFFLHQNYPNPFNPVTVIRYDIKETDVVSLKIYDVLGSEKSLIVNEKQSPGSYKIIFDGSFLSGGVYYYKLTSGNFSDTKKFVLIK